MGGLGFGTTGTTGTGGHLVVMQTLVHLEWMVVQTTDVTTNLFRGGLGGTFVCDLYHDSSAASFSESNHIQQLVQRYHRANKSLSNK